MLGKQYSYCSHIAKLSWCTKYNYTVNLTKIIFNGAATAVVLVMMVALVVM